MVQRTDAGTDLVRLARPDVGAAEAEAVAEVLESGQLTMGPKVAEFERRLAAACGTKHAVVVSSGNSGPNTMLFAPANDPFVITVGAVDVHSDGNPDNDFNAPWSAYGYTVDGFAKPEIAAPGRYVIEWVPSGTSLALARTFFFSQTA